MERAPPVTCAYHENGVGAPAPRALAHSWAQEELQAAPALCSASGTTCPFSLATDKDGGRCSVCSAAKPSGAQQHLHGFLGGSKRHQPEPWPPQQGSLGCQSGSSYGRNMQSREMNVFPLPPCRFHRTQ